MIKLDKKLLVGSGSRREVYLFSEKGKCIKVTPLEKKLKNKEENKHWYKKFRSLNYFDENNFEIKAYKYIKNEEVFKNLPRFYGVVDTDLGKAIVVDYIDKSISLRKFIEKYGVTKDFMEAMKNMFHNFVKNNITIRDCSPENYVVKVVDDRLRIYLVDGLGNANLIPLNRWIPYFGRKQTARRIKRMLRSFVKLFPKYRDEFESLLRIDFAFTPVNHSPWRGSQTSEVSLVGG